MENTNTARNFALQLGSLIALYVSLSALIAVIFGVITIAFPDAADGYWSYDSTQQGVKMGIALLIVFFPTYIVLTRLVNSIRRKETGTYLKLTKWLVYLSLLVGGVILLGDLVAVILTYLNGEITLRFILKAAALLVVIGAAFSYYIMDAKSYWNAHEKESKRYAAAASVAVAVVLALGFTHTETPSSVREIRLDEQQVQNLQDMQYRIEDHYRVNKSLPTDIGGLYIGTEMPQAPDGREPYSYNVTGSDTYELCATFAYPSQVDGKIEPMPVTEPVKNPYNNWDHAAGRTCFERTITDDMKLKQ
jgi:hypothetical protein